MKYIFVTGGVVSGLGKGITAASLGRLLKSRGLKVMARLNPRRELGQRLVEQAMFALFGPEAVKNGPAGAAEGDAAATE